MSGTSEEAEGELLEHSDFWAEILLSRKEIASAGPCVACPPSDEYPQNPKDFVLALEFYDSYITLCPYHEGELLTKLLRSYIRRKSKRRSDPQKAFLGSIPKNPEDYPCD